MELWMSARNMMIAEMACALESKRLGKKINATKPAAMINHRSHIDSVPRTLLDSVVFVRRYSHHDTRRVVTRAITTAQTLFVIPWLTL